MTPAAAAPTIEQPPRSYSPAQRRRMLERLVAKPHPEGATIGIPYFDEEFRMPQSLAHARMVQDLAQRLGQVAEQAGLEVISDNPVWYWDPAEDRQRIIYPDYALLVPAEMGSLTAKSLRLVVEVVSTERVEKEHKDSVRMRFLNEVNGVAEFLLAYPEPDDPRALTWYRYEPETGRYRLLPMPADRRYQSLSIPGLTVEVLRPGDWSQGHKLRVFHQGAELHDAGEARRAREAAERQAAEQRRAREVAERQAAEQRRAREVAEQQAADQQRAREAAECRAVDQQRAHAAAEREAARAQAENERLRALLRQAGIEP